MIYVTQADLQGYLPDFYVSTGTDDTRTGAIDLAILNSIISATVQRVKGLLQPSYTIDETATLPEFVKYAAVLLTVDQIFKRRGQAEHPYKTDVESLIEKCGLISKGEVSVDETLYADTYFGLNNPTDKPLLFGDVGARGSY